MKRVTKNQILSFVHFKHKKGATLNEILNNFDLKLTDLIKKVNLLIKDGLIFQRNDLFLSTQNFKLIKAEIIKNFNKFCFAKAIDEGFDIFIPVRFSKKALFGDIVLIDELPSRFVSNNKNLSKEGRVVAFCKKQDVSFTGIVVEKNESFFVKSDGNFEALLKISSKSKKVKYIQNGYKVLSKIDRHSFDFNNPSCKLIKVYGNSSKAYNCFSAYIQNSKIPTKFSSKILNEVQQLAFKKNDKYSRLDLTKDTIFTIDSASSKDLDDAVSIEVRDDFYIVGVHIADVSNFVDFKSALDKEALKRGTSIYIANQVIPMLVSILSDDICSLQPKKVRLTFSIFIKLNSQAKIVDFYFKKTKIKSVVKGVYEEINQVLTDSFRDEVTKNNLLKKYNKIKNQLITMLDLSKKLKSNRIQNGCIQLQSTECKIELDKNNYVTNITKKNQGLSENIIEEFMLLANECVAIFAKKNKIPILYRIHENPPIEKINNLKDLLNNLGINSSKIKSNVKSKILAQLLDKTRNSDIFTIINNNILKTLAKAKYDKEPSRHYGLALKNYTHFTSPIRRYCDLTVHRILSEYLFDKKNPSQLRKKYKNFLSKTAEMVNNTERNAIKIERNCESFFKAEFMSNKIGEKFEAIVCSCNKNGMFVQLENTVEGFVKLETLKDNYFFDGFCKLICKSNNKFYQVGQKIKVKCTFVNVNSKIIDFEVCI